jgi:hypothetical protein
VSYLWTNEEKTTNCNVAAFFTAINQSKNHQNRKTTVEASEDIEPESMSVLVTGAAGFSTLLVFASVFLLFLLCTMLKPLAAC